MGNQTLRFQLKSLFLKEKNGIHQNVSQTLFYKFPPIFSRLHILIALFVHSFIYSFVPKSKDKKYAIRSLLKWMVSLTRK